MKKILFTGMTGIHVNANRRRDYISFTHVLYNMLHELGYDIYWGTVDHFTPKLSSYDLVVCGLAQWNSRTSAFAYNALLASQHNNIIYYVDDWQLSNIQMTDKVLDNLFNDFMVGTNKSIGLLTLKLKKQLQAAAEDFLHKQINLIVPTFNWGDPNKLLSKLLYSDQYTLYAIDPSPFVKLKQQDSQPKNKHWVCSSLKDIRNSSFIKKLNLTWPIEYYYNKNYVSEDYLFNGVYATNYGIIAQKYYHAGSGWWRMRFLHSINSNSILLADNEEVKDIGDSFIIRQDTIEQMSVKQLNNVAQQQRQQFLKHQLSQDETLDKFSCLINII